MPVLFILFVVVPIVELIVLLQVSQVIGWGWAVLTLLGVSVVGAVQVKREGLRAWRRFRDALGDGRMPAEEVVDGALLLVAGALLLTPGYLTDAVGLLLLFPPTRGVVNHGLRTRVRRSVGLGPAKRGGEARSPEAPVDVEVVNVERTEQRDPDGDPPGALPPA